MKKYKLFVGFDFDGVILQSSDVKQGAFLEIVKETEPTLTPKLIEALKVELVGAERKKVAVWVCDRTKKISQQDFLKLFEKKTSLWLEKAPLVNGIESYLRFLGSCDIPFAIISAAPKYEILRMLEVHKMKTSIFVDIFGIEACPKANCLQALKHKFLPETEKFLYYGDMPSDMRAAKTSGYDFVRVESPAGIVCEWPKEAFRSIADFSNEKL